jgi:hypothetical protein
MAAGDKVLGEHADDPLGAAVAGGRDGQQGRGDEGDLHG